MSNPRTIVTGGYATRVARGAASELIAAADLMARGYHVFRALASTCPVDLMAYLPGEAPVRVEVKSVSLDSSNRHWWPEPKNDDWDLLMVVALDGFVASFTSDTTIEERTSAYRAARLASGNAVPDPPKPLSRAHCKRGHEFPEKSTTRRAADRFCRTCYDEGLIRLIDEQTV